MHVPSSRCMPQSLDQPGYVYVICVAIGVLSVCMCVSVCCLLEQIDSVARGVKS